MLDVTRHCFRLLDSRSSNVVSKFISAVQMLSVNITAFVLIASPIFF